jgi:exopolyphosphatase / guanosine-5'-triphosphate,3'-diphosphate pyrophosphatase
MEPGPVNAGVVDIGTNSMRLLITSADGEVGRWVQVTGLGEGIDATGQISEAAMQRSLDALSEFGRLMDRHSVSTRKAIATSASRDAANRDVFLAMATRAIGVAPTLIGGDQEARYAFDGAVGADGASVVVSDSGGGSTEFVTASDEVSVDIGSVRLGERCLPERPATTDQVVAARKHVADAFSSVAPRGESVVGVAGTWTSLAAIDLGDADRKRVDGHPITAQRLERIVDLLASLDLDETRSLPGLDPARAEVILPGALVAEGVLAHLGLDVASISERDTLDGVAKELLAQPQS